MTKDQTFIDRLWKDKNGKQTFTQTPNPPLIGWFVFLFMGMLVKTGKLHTASGYLAFGFLFTWAWLELYGGDSYFRRALGFIVIILLIYNKLK